MASLPTAPHPALKYAPVPPGVDQPPPHPAVVNYGSSPPSAKVSLTTWWEKFKKKPAAPKEGGDKDHTPGIFGVPLSKSIKYANVAISLTDGNGEQFIYGYVPIVVAKCGVFLKEKATNVEGIFRLSGSAKRIKDLQTIFNSPDKYGKGLDWAGYTVHDAANIFRRYLNQLPEPIIPLDFYARFREPLQCAQEDFDALAAIRAYQDLIGKLPALNRQLLLYILDLLAVFASKAEQNLMTASNLAAIFQPGLINHPTHDMSPNDYKLSQDVLVFLITNQDHFLLGMRGNPETEAVDNLSVPVAPAAPASPRRAKTVLSRSPSNSSAGADDVRKYGNLRRNVSVTSKRSIVGGPIVSNNSGGLSRSNTLPSKRSPNASPVTFRGENNSTPGSPRGGLAMDKNSISRSPSVGGRARDNATPVTTSSDDSSKTVKPMAAPPRTSPPPPVNTEVPPAQQRTVTTPTKERNFAASFFAGLSPEPHQRTGNKLRKQRPGSTTHSADSSTTNLGVEANASNPSIQNGHGPPPTSHSSIGGDTLIQASQQPHTAPTTSMLSFFGVSQQGNAPHSAASSATLMPAMSPTPSTTSSVASQSSSHEFSDTANPPNSPEKKRRSRWRLSGQKMDLAPTSPTFGNGHSHGHNSTASLAERIRGTSRSPPHRTRSVSGETSGMSDSEERRSALGWLSQKLNERRQHQQQCDREREQKEHGRPHGRDDMHLSMDNLPKMTMPLPGSPRVQPPTPSSVSLPTQPTQEHILESPRDREGNGIFRRDRQSQQPHHRNAPMHGPMQPSAPAVPAHGPASVRPSPMSTPRTSEERARMRESQPLYRETQAQQYQRELRAQHKEGQIAQREPVAHPRDNQGQVRSREVSRESQTHQRDLPLSRGGSQTHPRELTPNQGGGLTRQREVSADRRDSQTHQRDLPRNHRDGHMHQREASNSRDGHMHQREVPAGPRDIHKREVSGPRDIHTQLREALIGPREMQGRDISGPRDIQTQLSQMHSREALVSPKDIQSREASIPRDPQMQQHRDISGNQRETTLHQRETSAHHGESSTQHQEGSIHQTEVSELPLYAPVPGESIEPETQIQARRRPQAIRPGEPLLLQGIMPQGPPDGRMSEGMLSSPMSPGPMSPPGTAL
ncbi:uncharacterized protein LAJ45_08356 [Morchella importuna]|uniref:RhoGAP-domain-containing protein n=1 Tax=Morchella conica CCBAS932 TaxID=1392247 RepID=A0A3N4KP08_9PEZI|nr:uncharacterized protein LAJ45_08356 [Morchella importuna]KAH8147529.1 hypothetical protein LAJ45_08356 [Morchella importuna]RPB12230.1 RhoGAP-domain-containing protein [Morchella conica CCBAS932]